MQFALPKVFCFSERFSCLLERFCKNYNTFGSVGQMAFIFALHFCRLANCFRDALEHVLFTAAASSARTEAFCFAHPPLPEALLGFRCLETSGLFFHQSKTDGLRLLIEDRLLLTLCVWIQAASSITRLLASEAGGFYFRSPVTFNAVGFDSPATFHHCQKEGLVRVLARVSAIRRNISCYIDIS